MKHKASSPTYGLLLSSKAPILLASFTILLKRGPTDDTDTGDLNGDHHKDLVVSTAGSDVVSVFIGCGDGTFYPGVRYPVGPRKCNICVKHWSQSDMLLSRHFICLSLSYT